jgi:hypothetical protein
MGKSLRDIIHEATVRTTIRILQSSFIGTEVNLTKLTIASSSNSRYHSLESSPNPMWSSQRPRAGE